VASTDRPAADEGLLRRTTDYLVPDWVRVRRESFGLLFYDTRSTRLTFVRSGDGLIPPPFTGLRRVLRVSPLDEKRCAAVSRLLQKLVAKGLIVASEPE
jgi:putative mycofactocin binding protein MftB